MIHKILHQQQKQQQQINHQISSIFDEKFNNPISHDDDDMNNRFKWTMNSKTIKNKRTNHHNHHHWIHNKFILLQMFFLLLLSLFTNIIFQSEELFTLNSPDALEHSNNQITVLHFILFLEIEIVDELRSKDLLE
ncbi:hypothetical protein DERP_005596 [Dermatophagoides pteronyssinus]|uniref:Uncharacterized protein n=1 Tax=Dermatophagoides pteronyssinus TaxID=6956 RepID=A0ABQ8J940_DERPT|nr:hypothetical protein DERP_005596 [Dermatophagoides pteronyssinus]